MYDKTKNKLVKNLKTFEFEKEIYADKFMLENREKDDSINSQVDTLR